MLRTGTDTEHAKSVMKVTLTDMTDMYKNLMKKRAKKGNKSAEPAKKAADKSAKKASNTVKYSPDEEQFISLMKGVLKAFKDFGDDNGFETRPINYKKNNGERWRYGRRNVYES